MPGTRNAVIEPNAYETEYADDQDDMPDFKIPSWIGMLFAAIVGNEMRLGRR